MTIDFIGLAQQSTTAKAFEGAVLECLQEEVGFEVGFFSVKGQESEMTFAGFDSATANHLVCHGREYDDEILPVKKAALARRGVAVDTEVIGLTRVRQTRYHREIAAASGGKHGLMAFVPWGGSIAAAILLGRAGASFSERDIRRIEEALPVLGVARAAFGLPWASAPLESPPRKGWLERAWRGPRVLASVETSGGTLSVRDHRGYREMMARRGSSELVWTRARLSSPRESGWPYIELFHVAAALAKHRRSALFIGCGGAVAVRQFAETYPGIVIDLVECEPAVIDLARAWYDLSAIPRLTVHLDAGAEFVASASPSAWDVVVVDAYDAEDFAAEFSQPAFFAHLRRALRPGGAVAINVIGTLRGKGPVRDLVRLARGVFEEVRLVPVIGYEETYEPDTIRNLVVIGARPYHRD
jgi:spermidine synthase